MSGSYQGWSGGHARVYGLPTDLFPAEAHMIGAQVIELPRRKLGEDLRPRSAISDPSDSALFLSNWRSKVMQSFSYPEFITDEMM